MKIEILEEKEKKLMLNIKNEDTGFFSMLTSELNDMKDVKFAGYNVDHPLIKNIKLMLELNDDTKSKPKEVLKEALTSVKKKQSDMIEEFLEETNYSS